MDELTQLKLRVSRLERLLNAELNPITPIKPKDPEAHEYVLPPGQYTTEDILKRFPNLTPWTMGKHIKYPRKRVRVYEPKLYPAQPTAYLKCKKVWVYIVPETVET